MTPARQRILTVGLIVVGVAIAGFFGLRTFHALRSFHGHRSLRPPGQVATDVNLIRDWMTVPFISRTYRVPPEALFDAVGIPARENQEKSLLELNEEYFPQDNGFVLAKVKAAVSANQPPTPPTAPSP